jgi:nifR3 family TIM-barrel protein
MGCPAKRVVAGACGSALMKEPELAQHLVRIIRNAVPEHIPVTVKHRAGWDGLHRNAPEFACAMVEAGVAMITVHGRTRTQGFSGQCDREIIRMVREQVPSHIPVVGNGDVVDLDSYRRMKEETGCDAVMIGRGALGNPWLFRSLRAIHLGNPDPGRPSLDERIETFRRHLHLIMELKSGKKLIHEVRKATAWYAKGLHGCNALRQVVWKISEPSEVIEAAEIYFEKLRMHQASRAA